MVGAIYNLAQITIRKRKRENEIPCVCEFINRKAISGYGIPKPQKLDFYILYIVFAGVAFPTRDLVPQEEQDVAQATEDRCYECASVVALSPVRAECFCRQMPAFAFRFGPLPAPRL